MGALRLCGNELRSKLKDINQFSEMGSILWFSKVCNF